MGTPIALSFKNLNDRQFIESVRGLVNHRFDSMTTAYRLKKIMDKIDAESKKASELWQQEYNKLEMETDESGVKRPKNPDEFAKFQEQFLATQCDVGNRLKLHVNDIIGYKLSAIDMAALEPILEGFDVLEEKEG